MFRFLFPNKGWNLDPYLEQLPQRERSILIETRVVKDRISITPNASNFMNDEIIRGEYRIKPDDISPKKEIQQIAIGLIVKYYSLFIQNLDFDNSPRIEILARDTEGKVVGTLFFAESNLKVDNKRASRAYISGFYVDPDRRGTSAAISLIREGIMQAHNYDLLCSEINIEKHIPIEQVKRVVKLYSRFGFEAYIFKGIGEDSIRIIKAKNNRARKLYIEDIGLLPSGYELIPLSEVDVEKLRSKIKDKEGKDLFQILKRIFANSGSRRNLIQIIPEQKEVSSDRNSQEISHAQLLDSSFRPYLSLNPAQLKAMAKGKTEVSPSFPIGELVTEYCCLFFYNYSRIKAEEISNPSSQKDSFKLLVDFMHCVLPFLEDGFSGHVVKSLFYSLFQSPEHLSSKEIAFIFVHQILAGDLKAAIDFLPCVRSDEKAYQISKELIKISSRNSATALPAFNYITGENKVSRAMEKILQAEGMNLTLLEMLWDISGKSKSELIRTCSSESSYVKS